MKLAHAAQNGLPGLPIGLEMQRGIGAHHLAEGRAEFFLIDLVLCLHRDADDRVGEAHALQDDRIRGIAQGIAGFRVGERYQRDDVAGARLLDGIRFLGKHFHHTADLLALAARRIHDRSALGEQG